MFTGIDLQSKRATASLLIKQTQFMYHVCTHNKIGLPIMQEKLPIIT